MMDDDNWLTVGKPKKVKTGAKKVVNEEKGDDQQNCFITNINKL